MKPLFFTFVLFALNVISIAEEHDIEKVLYDGNNQFTARMFSEVVKNNEAKSVVLSAYSVITPLAQLALASEGPSQDELLNGIGFRDEDTTKAIFSLIDVKDRSTKGIQLQKASKLYISHFHRVNDEFAKVSESVFHSEIANIDFGDNEKAAKQINTWVENQTNNRIQDLIDPSDISGATAAVLVNALYFKGFWKHPFNKAMTREKDFHVTKTETIKVSMMQRTLSYSYGYSNLLRSKFLELPYEGDQASLLIVLPDDVEYIRTLIEQLKDPNILNEETKGMYKTETEVSLPKFKVETTTNLVDVLIKMNITKVFGPDAKLNKLIANAKDLHVSKAIQKAFIEVNEEGAEAAAANAFYVQYSDAIDLPQFNADHPFVFYLKVHGYILFNGLFYGS